MKLLYTVRRQLLAAWARIVGVVTRDRLADDLREEMAFHL